MKSRQEAKVKEGARQFLEPDEDVIAAIVARPRGWTQAMAGSLHLGARQQGDARQGADAAGVELASPMAVAITQRRLLTLELGATIGMGAGGAVKRLMSAVPLADVDSIEVKRLALGKIVKITVRGSEFKLEVNAAADAKGLAAAVERGRAVAG
jgi:hypothetical protein